MKLKAALEVCGSQIFENQRSSNSPTLKNQGPGVFAKVNVFKDRE